MGNVIPLTIRNAGPRRKALGVTGHGGSPSGTSSASQEAARARSTSRSRACVFILDDQFTGRKILQELVQSIDPALKVETFDNPHATLLAAAQRTPDLVLTDFKMPELDGVEFTRRLRAIRECADVPVVMITVVEDPEVRYRALDAGATDFLVRPIDQHECRARCRNLLTLRRQQKLITHRARWLEDQVSTATRQIHNRERETLLRLAKAGSFRDESTGCHVLRMARFARLIAERFGLPAPECEELELAAPMHDIGKIGIPDQILLKPSALALPEWEIMKTHTMIGYEILKDSASHFIQQGAVIALHHHERYDGSGYPYGLSGEAIPVSARIAAVADVYDALTTERAYKPAWSSEAAVTYIRGQSGHHFDPRCVDALIACLNEIRAIPPEGSTTGR